MDDRLLPRKVPEPTRFPSAIFEPCVPDASLIFGCGLFEAPKAPAEVTKPSHKTESTEDILRGSTRETVVPPWIKAYGVEKKTGVDACNFEQCHRRHVSTEDSERREDFEVFERRSAVNFSGRTDSGLVRPGTTCLGEAGVGTATAERIGYEDTAAVQETAKRGERFGKNAFENVPKGTEADSFVESYPYSLEGNKLTSLQTRDKNRHSGEQWGSVTSVHCLHLGDSAGRTDRPTGDLPDLTGFRRHGTASAAHSAARGETEEDAVECSRFSPGHPDRRGEVTRYTEPSDRIALGETRGIVSDVIAPRLPRDFDFRKEGDKFPEPQKGFISSDCSLSDYNPLNVAKRRAKWKNRISKETDLGSVTHEKVGRDTRESVPRATGTSRTRGCAGRAKRRDAAGSPHADFGNFSTVGELGRADPVIEALFHLQNRHTELLLQLAADVGDVASKQRRMFDVFQRLQSAFCDSGARATAEAPAARGGERRRRCDKCTQTSGDGGERVPVASADASTQSDGTGDGEGGKSAAAAVTGVGVAAVAESRGSHEVPQDFGAAERAASEETESGTCVADRSEGRGVQPGAGPGEAPASAAVSAGDVRRLVAAVRSIAARVEDSGGKTRHLSRKAGSGTPEVDAGCSDYSREAARGVASRYKNNYFIKPPNLEDVAEASENSSDSEDGEVSEVGDESLTIGDLSLVPQNVSPSPDPSLRIDSRGLEISSDALASGSDDSESEASAHCCKEKEDHLENTDTTAIYLYRNIFSKVQEILEHSKPASESSRENSGKKPSTAAAKSGRTRARPH